ncbi:dienelactone hydrolase family protein [Roseomonas sp. NAR14]|uniref:Dienelactone hydrolase family protein n=1 Tax=Roseomonas acroporae TaxID=2937791 RepID=A0A9X1YC13_9PROT|nr:dienelactone hydrolase family protein [Roseomonas acroporae]MCK8786982.1 dienelactone hydrolase family protein [Roseomonas acroporae]
MTVQLKAADGHEFGAYVAGPEDAAVGLVVIQEIFGVNHHMRNVCEGFAAHGYRVVSPALFDRAERGVELGYGPEDRQRGLALRAGIGEAAVMADVAAAAESLGGRRLGIVGYCWGGTIAWWGATRTGLFRAAVGYYGGGIVATKDAAPRCPVQLHFGELDGSIPLKDVEAIRAAQPGVEVFVYGAAQHGFACDERESFKPDAATLAEERTLAFLNRHLG